MIKNVNVSHTITATQNDEGKFVLNSPVELIPKEVVEQLMDMAAEAAIQKLVDSDAKELTETLLSDSLRKQLSSDLLMWKIIAWIALAFVVVLLLELKGVM